MNRDGLIDGATRTGKSKTLQIIAEQLSQQGVTSLVMGIKGDLPGITSESPWSCKNR
jgi:DNA helicase HerA-like ATPase